MLGLQPVSCARRKGMVVSMKVFISADIEGVADLVSFAEAGNENPQLYTRGMEQMSREVGAVCRGAIAAGAEIVTVKDAHGGGMNIFHEYLPEQAQLIRGEMRSPYSMIGNIDGSYDAVVFVGYHDAAGQDGNPMAHTISSRRIREITINGVPAGEFHLFSYAAMGLGVPTAMISGDAAICEKAKAVNSRIETVVTKEGVAAAVISRHPKAVERELEEAAKRALSGDLNRYRYALPEHFRVTVAYQKHYDAAYASHYFNTRRLDAHTVEFCSDDYEEVLRFFHFVL